MPEPVDDRLDRFVSGQLTAEEERALAQAALDDPDLFDLLTATALTQAATGHRPDDGRTGADGGDRAAAVAASRRRTSMTLAALATVAASVIAIVVVERAGREPIALTAGKGPPVVTAAPAAPSAPPAIPATPSIRPAVLHRALNAVGSPAFRGVDADSRAPKRSGQVVSVEDGGPTVDVGALDGITRGATLNVVRAGSGRVAQLTIARVFRERASGDAVPRDAVQPGDIVEIPAAIQLSALLDQVSARLASGDLDAARTIAEQAVAIAQSPGAPADRRRRALADLGALDARAGALDAAETHLRAAANELDAAPAASEDDRAEILNELGATLIDRGNLGEADTVLQRAEARATGAAAVRIANNRAIVAALHGDRAAADTLYRRALALAGTARTLADERHVIETNLDGLSPRR
jgi:hypothetical protein